MSWDVVARKEFRDALRSKGLWVLSLVFTAFFVIPAAAALYFDVGVRGDQAVGMQLLIEIVYLNIVTLFLPLVAIFAGYAAISKERTSGSLKLLLSLPHSRKDVIIGKVVGRCGVVGVPLAGAFLVNALFLMASRLTFKPGLYVTFALFSMVFALVIVAVAVSISGAVENSLYSIVGNMTFFVSITFFWNLWANSIGDGLWDYLGVTGATNWSFVLFLKLLNPSQAYKTIMNSMLGEGSNAARSARFRMFSGGNTSEQTTICNDVLAGNANTTQGFIARTNCLESAQSMPIYFSDGAALFYLLLWIGLAAAVSYYTFNQYDL
ncbi:ABC-2 type transport system permease protein [Halomicrobium zhouii]|uniref:ABC-2 type transport system permease protein n=1 Tax=Halomicrobium zhouii TaxID=767519 RepID=A0A1I6KDQ1_9EURY|nr:ABC transporter permease subunit [Halomicrobium zhouii]SFR88990.1 ABC-2 type transport system permease protein [Halomicrobium zhouii]